MKHPLILVLTMMGAALSLACSDDSDGSGPNGGAGGSGGGTSGGAGGSAGNGGGAGSTSNAGAAGSPAPPTPALPEGAPTVACPTVINGALSADDPRQVGRHSRIAPISECGATKGYPGNAADPTGPHLFDVYRFINPGASAACFTFTLSYGDAGPVVADAGADAGADASVPVVQDAGLDAGGAGGAPAAPAPPKYLTAHGIFYPTDLGRAHLGDVGDSLVSPHTMGITVPAGETIDVVVYAVDTAPAGVGSYTLSCATQ
jgi:hypothetical protein